jgi:ribonuclease BN (tRNA processing enzyme)
MRITVLGSGAAYPRAGGACAGLLVSSGETHVWVDAGNGTFANLQRHISYRDVEALVLTHGHADHVADVLPFMYALGFDPDIEARTLPLYTTPGTGEMLSWPLGGKSLEIFKQIFAFHSIAEPFSVGPVRFEPFRTVHPAETYGLRMSEGDGDVAVYTSDTAAFDGLADHCRDADLLLCEATYVEGAEASPNVHMWANEAGQLARDAGAKRLALMHVWPTFDLEVAVSEAAAVYGGPTEAAIEGNVYHL